MDRFSLPSLGSLRRKPSSGPDGVFPHLVPFGPYGGGQWTGHWIGLVIVLGFIAMGLVAIPEWRGFFLASLVLGALLGCALSLWRRSRAAF